MPRSEVIEDLRQKVARAGTHLSDLQAMITEFRRTGNYRITKHVDRLHNRYMIRLHSPPATYDLPLILGDFIYNLRSALDHLAWQLSHLTIPVPPTTVLFPIHERSDAKSEKQFKERVSGVPPDAVAEIHRRQPFQRGSAYRDDPLWKLNALSNIDKHRMFAISSNIADVFVSPRVSSTRHTVDYFEFVWPLTEKSRVVFEPYQVSFRFGHPIDVPGESVEVTEQEVADIHRYVRDDVLPAFERFFRA